MEKRFFAYCIVYATLYDKLKKGEKANIKFKSISSVLLKFTFSYFSQKCMHVYMHIMYEEYDLMTE